MVPEGIKRTVKNGKASELEGHSIFLMSTYNFKLLKQQLMI
jgi:hypothetical protein